MKTVLLHCHFLLIVLLVRTYGFVPAHFSISPPEPSLGENTTISCGYRRQPHELLKYMEWIKIRFGDPITEIMWTSVNSEADYKKVFRMKYSVSGVEQFDKQYNDVELNYYINRENFNFEFVRNALYPRIRVSFNALPKHKGRVECQFKGWDNRRTRVNSTNLNVKWPPSLNLTKKPAKPTVGYLVNVTATYQFGEPEQSLTLNCTGFNSWESSKETLKKNENGFNIRTKKWLKNATEAYIDHKVKCCLQDPNGKVVGECKTLTVIEKNHAKNGGKNVDPPGSGLGAGAIVGIIITVLVIAVVLAAVGYYIWMRKKDDRKRFDPVRVEMDREDEPADRESTRPPEKNHA